MKQFDFTPTDTKIAKGVAIILMIVHHLFAFPKRINFDYISFGHIGNNTIEFLIGSFGKICVAMFIFLSGFGLYKQFGKENDINLKNIIIKKIKKIYIYYWIIFVMFVPIGFIFFEREFVLSEFIDSIIGYKFIYNEEWWFLKAYVLLIILFPLFIGIIKKYIKHEVVSIILLVIIIYSVLPTIVKWPMIEKFFNNIYCEELLDLSKWIPAFIMGIIFAKNDLYSKIKNIFLDNKLDNILIDILGCMIIMYVRYRNNSIQYDYLLAPMIIYFTNNIIKRIRLKKLFVYIGEHSMNMWLTHSFFCYYYFQELVFYPRYSMIIILWLIILSLSTSNLINFIIEKITVFIYGGINTRL